jgi:transcription termination factor NusB
MWWIIKNELQKNPNKVNIHTLNIEGKKTSNLNHIANTFNKYFTEVADKIHKHIKDLDPNYNFKLMSYI